MDAHKTDVRASELFPGVTFNILTMELVTARKRVPLTPPECNLLEFFLEDPSRVRSKDEIARHCFRFTTRDKKAVYDLVYQLRNTACLASVPREEAVVLVRGKGYKLGRR